MVFRYKMASRADNKLALPVQGRVVWALSEHRYGWLKICKHIPAFTPLSLRSPTPSWLTVKLYISPKQQKSRWLLSSALFGSHSWTRTNDILINSQALYRLSYAGIFNFVLNHLCRLSFCRATLLPTPFPSLSFGSLRGNPSGAVPTWAMREYLILF